MFGMLTDLTKAVIGLAVTPVAVVIDVVTLGGELTDHKGSYTGANLEEVAKNFNKVTNPK